MLKYWSQLSHLLRFLNFFVTVQKCPVTVTDDDKWCVPRRQRASTKWDPDAATCFSPTFVTRLNLTLHTPQFISVTSAPHCEMLFDSLGDVGVWALLPRERAAVAELLQFCPRWNMKSTIAEKDRLHTFGAGGILEASAPGMEKHCAHFR